MNSYYAGSSLTIVVRGVDPIKQFFVAVYQKKNQYDAFNTKSGDRVGYIAKESEVAGTRLTCSRRAIASRPAMNSTNEFSCDWKVRRTSREKCNVPCMLDWSSIEHSITRLIVRTIPLDRSASPGPHMQAPTIPPGQGVESTGVVVVKVTLTRDPLSIGPDEEDPGLVHLSYTLKEVAPPKKGSVLSEMSQKVEKEEKKYDVDVVAMHQLFIDFLRNQDLASAATMLSPKCYLTMDGEKVEGQQEVMDSMCDLSSGSVIMKDSQILCAGITLNSLDRDIAAIQERIKREKEAEDERQRIKAEAAAAAAAVEAAMLEAADAEGGGGDEEGIDPSNQGDPPSLQRSHRAAPIANPELTNLHEQGTKRPRIFFSTAAVVTCRHHPPTHLSPLIRRHDADHRGSPKKC